MLDLINEPDASRLVEALRDTGYDFQSAAADIVDNSIAAGADRICVNVEMKTNGERLVYFGDNGHGMDDADLRHAMRYGAPVRDDLASLGKFGLGLKTASTAICRRLTVISRKSPNAPLAKFAWDLDHIAKTNRWEMLSEAVEPHEQDAWDELCAVETGTGTLVVWSNCDRLISGKVKQSSATNAMQNAIKRLRKNLGEHLGMIYHRFLDLEDDRCRNIAISVNDNPVQYWNPFCIKDPDSESSEFKNQLEGKSDDGEVMGVANIRAQILPHKYNLSQEERDLAKTTYSNQGFYIYREGRLIIHGDWLGMFKTHGHLVLLRIEFDIGHELDEIFYVDVKKSSIRFNQEIEEVLKEMLKPIVRQAQNRQKSGQQTIIENEINTNHRPSNLRIDAAKATMTPTIVEVDPEEQTAILVNKRGSSIQIRHPIQKDVDSNSIRVDAVDTIKNGDLWVPSLRSSGGDSYVIGVQLNKNHDYYQKVYAHATLNKYPVHGIDFLLWALSAAEFDNTDDELEPIFRDIREVVSFNLRKLLSDYDLPNVDNLDEEENEE